ncbi:MAG: leucyl/phenylalanyl-tRNA--protein transferase [Actinomycetales bacterium]|nr:leucyl/phenylalanyl-tRNA--protein transferase [Actinomycetales bacterium]
MPRHPGPTGYVFQVANAEPGEDLIGVGADLQPATLITAYRSGAFPMGLGRGGRNPMGWWSPDPRGVIRPAEIHVSRSLRRSMRHFDVTIDVAFEQVMLGCADPARTGRWITPAILRAYRELHRLGWAHSIEVWQESRLVGGLYGVAIGGLFAGESMFHRATDASKAALVTLAEMLVAEGDSRRIIDVQWVTPHLSSLGAVEVTRETYLTALTAALDAPLPERWS